MQKKQIRSVESPDSPKPWYLVEIRDNAPYIVEDKDGGTDFNHDGVSHSVPDFVDLPSPAQKTLSSDAVYAVTQSGEFIAYGLGTDLAKHGISLRAHLAWYDSETDEFTVLEFVEQ